MNCLIKFCPLKKNKTMNPLIVQRVVHDYPIIKYFGNIGKREAINKILFFESLGVAVPIGMIIKEVKNLDIPYEEWEEKLLNFIVYRGQSRNVAECYSKTGLRELFDDGHTVISAYNELMS